MALQPMCFLFDGSRVDTIGIIHRIITLNSNYEFTRSYLYKEKIHERT
jgi:hypothetical protein